MSYCRWSSDDFLSDVYVYEDCSGYWVIWVASLRREYKKPLPAKIPTPTPSDAPDKWNQYIQRLRTVTNMECELVPIGGLYDGEKLTATSPGECADQLEMLREEGYHIPEGVIESLREEQEERVV